MAPPRATTCRVCGAPRYEGCEYALCETHLRAVRQEENTRLIQARAPDARRLRNWLRMAAEAGASEDEAWRVALAISLAYDAGECVPGVWTRQRIAAELAYLRRTVDARAKLDAWQPVAGFVNTEWTPPAAEPDWMKEAS